MKNAAPTFDSHKELGVRLRALRKRRGYTQSQLARTMGRKGRRADNVISRIERGNVRFLSVAQLLDYLRACRAETSDIADILDTYLRQPTVLELESAAAVQSAVVALPALVQRGVLRYDAKTEVAQRVNAWMSAAHPELPRPRPRILTAEQRRQRVETLIGRSLQKGLLEDALYDFLKEQGAAIVRGARRPLCELARARFRVLLRRPRPTRRKRAKLDKLAASATAAGATPHQLALLGDLVAELIGTLRRQDWLDPQAAARVPAAGRSRPFTTVLAHNRLAAEEMAPIAEYDRKLLLVRANMNVAVGRLLETLGLDVAAKRPWRDLVRDLLGIAIETEDQPEERGRRIQAAVALSRDAALAADIVAVALPQYDLWKKVIPPNPRPAPS
jgi:transcriptional regulator with XRE-family HTH domain